MANRNILLLFCGLFLLALIHPSLQRGVYVPPGTGIGPGGAGPGTGFFPVGGYGGGGRGVGPGGLVPGGVGHGGLGVGGLGAGQGGKPPKPDMKLSKFGYDNFLHIIQVIFPLLFKCTSTVQQQVVMVDMVDMVEELEAFSQELDRRLLKEVQEDLCYHMQDLLFLRWAFQEGVLVVVSERKLPKCQVSECRDFTKVDWYLDKDLVDVEFCLLEGQDKQVKDRLIKSVHMYSVTGGRGYGGPMQQGLFHGYPLKSPKVQGGYGTKSGGKQPLGYGFGNGGAGLPGGQGGPVLRPGYPELGPVASPLLRLKLPNMVLAMLAMSAMLAVLVVCIRGRCQEVLAVLVFSIQGRCQEVLAVLVVCIHGRCQEVLAMLAVLVVCIQGRCQEVLAMLVLLVFSIHGRCQEELGPVASHLLRLKPPNMVLAMLAMLAVLAVLVFSIHGRCQEVLAMLAVLGVLVFHIQGRCQEELGPVASQLLRLKLPNMVLAMLAVLGVLVFHIQGRCQEELGPVASHLLRLKLPNMVWVQLVVLLALVDCIQGNGQEALVDCIQGNCQEALVDCIQGNCQEALVDCIQGKCQEALVDCIQGNCQEALVDCIQGNCQEVKAVQGVFQVVVQVEEEFLDESHFYQDMDGMDLGLESNPQSMEFQEELGQGLYQEPEEYQQVPVIYQEADNTLLPQKLLNMELREALEQGLFQDGEEQEQFLEFKEEPEWGSYQEQEEYQQEASLGLALGGDQLLQLQSLALAQMIMLLGCQQRMQVLLELFNQVEQVLQYPLVLVQLAKASLVLVKPEVDILIGETTEFLMVLGDTGHINMVMARVGCSIPLQVDWEVLEVELNHPNQATVILEVAVFISQVALRDARANSVGGGSRAHQCDLDKPRCYCMI
ncbi:Glycine-rich protein A3 [Dissostichus eleginoides]|uniref:Glycine-rich protein A3 n=1 Tax=Dissostichus eleginoides TaxID=100907 RepID=A0AAD9CFS9_DISEL|nr:Glycine-rich protein A3 [Dissostichus eleginoides]